MFPSYRSISAAVVRLLIVATGCCVYAPATSSAVTLLTSSSTSSVHHNGTTDTTPPTVITATGDTISASPAVFTTTPVGSGFEFAFTSIASVSGTTSGGGSELIVGSAPFTGPTSSHTHSLFSVTFSLSAGETMPFVLNMAYALGITSGGGDVRSAWVLEDLTTPSTVASNQAVLTTTNSSSPIPGTFTDSLLLDGGVSGRTYQFSAWVEIYQDLTNNSNSYARIESLDVSVAPEPSRALLGLAGLGLLVLRRGHRR